MERAKQHTRVFTFNNFDLVHSNLVQVSPIDAVPLQSVSNDDGSADYFVGNDIALLFNQERLTSLGPDTIKKFFDNLQNSSSSNSLKELRSKCSDSDLLNLCKSRFIQTPSELLSWSNYLNENYNQLVNSLKSLTVNDDSSSVVDDSSKNDSSSTTN